MDGEVDVKKSFAKGHGGLSWQIIPQGFADMMKSSDKAAIGRAFQAMMTMAKLHLPTLQKAFDGG